MRTKITYERKDDQCEGGPKDEAGSPAGSGEKGGAEAEVAKTDGGVGVGPGDTGKVAAWRGMKSITMTGSGDRSGRDIENSQGLVEAYSVILRKP